MSQNQTANWVFFFSKITTLYTPYNETHLLKWVSAYISFECHRPQRQENLLQQCLLVQSNLGFSRVFLSVLSENLVGSLRDKKMKRLQFLCVALALPPSAPLQTSAVTTNTRDLQDIIFKPIESTTELDSVLVTFQSLKSNLNTKWL